MRNGVEAIVIRGLRRATVGLGVPGTGEATWVQIEPAPEEPASERAHELAKEYRGAVEAITDARGVPAVAEFLRGVDRPGPARRHVGLLAGPVLRPEGGRARDPRRRSAAREGAPLGQGDARGDPGEGADPRRGGRQPRGATAGGPPARADGGDPQGARRGRRRRRRRRVPHEDRRRRDAGGRAHAGRARARPARADVRAVAGVRLDPHLPRLVARRALVEDDRGHPRHRRRTRSARRRPRGTARREGPDPRIPRRPEAPERARARGGRGPRLRGDPHVGRTSGRREDVARRVRGACARAIVRPRLARRRPRRIRDPWSPQDLRRSPSRPDRPGVEGRGDEEPRDDARRGRQGRRRLAGRPVERVARGPRPCPEPHVPRPLPGRRSRPVRGAVHRDRERRRDDRRAAARPDGGHPDRRLHRGREGRDRAPTPAAPTGRAERPATRGGRGHR